MTRKILVIEDDQATRDYVAHGFEELGWTVERCDTGEDGLEFLRQTPFDLVVLDRNLPGIDGLSVLKELRALQRQEPVIILSAIAHVDERVKGLRAGGDDYIVKPFHFSELLARSETVLRRKAPESAKEELTCRDLTLNLATRRVFRAGREVALLPREFKLLEYFLRHAGKVVTREMLIEGVWDYTNSPHANVIDTHVSRLRKKIEDGAPLIETIRNVGYRFGGER